MKVGIVTVGDELLSGETENTNASWLGRRLAERGVTVDRTVVAPDEVGEIATETRRLAERYDAVIVTGGLGPTHDDVTMDGVAAAFDRQVVEHSEAVAWFEERDGYHNDDLAEGTTFLPEGARLLPNEAGVAPGAVVENVYVLPGVPAEMKAMFEAVESEFEGERTHVEVVHSEKPESALVDTLTEVQEQFDVTVGSYPGDGVRIRVGSHDPATASAAAAWLRERV
ncbi:molybdopterin-binding protein [Salarchaeum sp. JOR-1]|uniref:competence/damage-inducible protein A n=1 Tax=Salarchaeum sp. JOR-1 TaxID=2599399 RepID=UPI00119841D5|nr:molybdopterin-binding protein [Salarchaeum sp. JOR-1]QDX41382.1 competence/damage-inducible protein A [Salarchaeum sp. JOR-1]